MEASRPDAHKDLQTGINVWSEDEQLPFTSQEIDPLLSRPRQHADMLLHTSTIKDLDQLQGADLKASQQGNFCLNSNTARRCSPSFGRLRRAVVDTKLMYIP